MRDSEVAPYSSSSAVADVDDIAILDDVVFALQVKFRGLLQVDFGGVA